MNFNFFASPTEQQQPAGNMMPQVAQPVLNRPMLNMPQIQFKPIGLRPLEGNAGNMLTQARTPSLKVVQPQKARETEDSDLQNLKDVRRTCGLKEVPVRDALQTFQQGAEATSGVPSLSLTRFCQTYADLMRKQGLDTPSQPVMVAVFKLFDKDGNGVVDMLELVCGISMLCKGSEDEKIHAVFELFDIDGNGYISMDEMFKFLTSVFKIVLTPNVLQSMKSMGVEVESAEDLASVTSLECFKTADLNGDGKLSIDEFKTWFYAPKNDPGFMFSPMRKLLH